MSSTPAAVAASDPGGDSGRAEPKQERAARASSGPAGDSDVTMTEASEEAPAAADVKAEGSAVPGAGVLTADAVREEASATTLADPLYFTEAAGMVVAEGAEAEPEAPTGQTERKLVPAGDVAESTELEENHVNVAGQDNGVAHFDEGTQNGPETSVQCARYSLPPLDIDGFRVSDLVWGKVKSHPWWPGEIFDPSNASELALKHQKKGCRLVAYFGDNSFAWCDESQLKPFVTNYSQMEKQSSSDAFVGSVNYALEELSRRILSGMSCSCLPEELSDNGMSYMVENAGLKDGVTCSSVNRSEILTCFSPESLLHYIKSLALFPGQGGDLLELVIACSQLTSLYRSKGCPELASFQTGSAWVEDTIDTSPTTTNNVVIEEVVVIEEPPAEVKPKRGRGRPRKHKPNDNLELAGKKGTSSLSNNNASYNTPQSVRDFEDSNKKKRSLDSVEDSDAKSPTTAVGGSFKIGECIRRAANQLTGSSSAVKSQNELENAEFDVSSDDAVNELTVEKRAKRRRLHMHHIADPKELFSQLCSVALEPMDKYDSSALLISYFSDYRNYIVSATTEASVIEKTASKRGRKKRVLPSPELETTDHMQDSYWSGLSLHNHPIHSLKRAATNTRPRRKRKSLYNTVLSSVQHEEEPPKKQIQVIERSIIHVDEKIVDEWKPTALVLSFGRSTALPSERGLIKIFGRYGPLKESETEVQKNTNTVKIVFKKRADAERAFSAAGKYGTLGPSLRSYRLVNMPFTLGVSEPNKPEVCPGDHGPEVPGPSKPEIPLDTMKVDQVDKTEKAEAVKASSGGQVETLKKTCQSEPVKESSGGQVTTVQQACQPDQIDAKLTGPPDQIDAKITGPIDQIDAKITGPPDQIATATHNGQTEMITKESSGTMEQASLEKQSEIALSGAGTGAVQVVGATEPDREAPLNKSAKQVTEADTENEVPEETKVPMELQAQGSVEKPVEQDATEQTLEIQAPKEVSVEIPRDVKLESKSLTEESVNQVATEQVKAPSDAVPSDTSDVQVSELQPETTQVQAVGGTSIEQEGTAAEADIVQDVTEASSQEAGPNKRVVEHKTAEVAAGQVSCAEQTVQVDDIIDASGGHTAVGKQTTEEVTMAEFEGAVESKVEAPVAETVEDKATGRTLGEAVEGTTTAEASGGHTDVGKQTAEEVTMAEVMVEGAVESKVEARVEEIVEDKATGRKLGEAVEGTTTAEAPGDAMKNADAAEATSDVPDERMEKATAKALACDTTDAETTAKAPIEKATTAEKPVEAATIVEAPDEKATAAEKPVEDAKVEAPDEKAATAEKTAKDATAEARDEKAVAAKRTTEDPTVEALDEKATTSEKTAEDAMVEAPDEKAVAAKKTSEDPTVEAPDEKATTSEKTAEDATVEAPDETATTSEKTAEDATVEAPDEKATAEAPDEKAMTSEKTAEDAMVEAPDEKATKSEKNAEDAIVKAPDEKAVAAKKASEDATVEAPDEKATTSKKTAEDAMVEAPDEKATAEAPDEKAMTSEKTAEDAMVEAPDEKATTSEKTAEDAMVEVPDEKAMTSEKPAEDAMVEVPDEKATTSEKTAEDAKEGTTVEAADVQVGGVTEQTG